MNYSRRNFLKFLAAGGLALLGCEQQNPQWTTEDSKPRSINHPANLRRHVSYKLEDLCDTEVNWKAITLHVYIEDSRVVWDYRKYKEELFGYVAGFFKENKINCKVVYSERPFNGSNSCNEFKVEIFDSTEKVKDRYAKLLTGLELLPEENPLILDRRGYAATRAGTALINAGWEEFREWVRDGDATIKEIEEQFNEEYKGTTIKIYLLKENAANICHETLHCLGLFHPLKFNPPLVEDYYQGTPNIMSYKVPKLEERYILGYCLTTLQQKLIHSFIAGNNNYEAFADSQRDLDIYLENLALGNNLELFSHSSLDFISSLTSALKTL